jgi:hypothetical protein
MVKCIKSDETESKEWDFVALTSVRKFYLHLYLSNLKYTCKTQITSTWHMPCSVIQHRKYIIYHIKNTFCITCVNITCIHVPPKWLGRIDQCGCSEIHSYNSPEGMTLLSREMYKNENDVDCRPTFVCLCYNPICVTQFNSVALSRRDNRHSSLGSHRT